MGPDLILNLLPTHVAAIELEIQVAGIELEYRVREGLRTQKFHEPVPAGVKIFPQAVPQLYVMFGVLVVDRAFGIRGHGVAGIELVVEFLEADLLPLRPAHSVKLRRHYRVRFLLPLPREEITDIGGGGPLHRGYELPDEVSAEGHSTESQMDGGMGSRGVSPGKRQR